MSIKKLNTSKKTIEIERKHILMDLRVVNFLTKFQRASLEKNLFNEKIRTIENVY